jgi:hypothetical protein
LRADCIRVTHPYDTLAQILLLKLPFVLHVLGLPLAFILSQDQTLHSIFFSFNFRITPSINTSLVVQSSFEASNSQPMSFNPWSSLTFYVLNNIPAIHLKEINSNIPSIEYIRVRYQSPFIQRTFVLFFNSSLKGFIDF